MCPLLETLRIEKGEIHQLSFHNERMNRSRRDCFGSTKDLDLRNFIQPEIYEERTKCRVVYRDQIEKIEYSSYALPSIRSLRLVTDDKVDYTYKSTDREALKQLYRSRENCDDIIIVKNDLLTDTFFCNIALWNGNQWQTPAQPLLKGTCRASLLEEGKIIEKDIRIEDLDYFSRICLFNAMISFGEIDFSFIKREKVLIVAK
ncbi:MAG: aminotransferase class IV family protein [Tannerellaceae bacterium]|nr:aminotransferase class IV family protein [Tannerellaceae bacterium]